MRLTAYSDYSLRLLIYLGTQPLGLEKLYNIKDIAEVYGISKNHLSKIVYDLGQLGILETVKGRSGGIRLAKNPEDINVGWLIRRTEGDMNIVECFVNDDCRITSVCRLKHILKEAFDSYLSVLDRYSLADLIINQDALLSFLSKK